MILAALAVSTAVAVATPTAIPQPRIAERTPNLYRMPERCKDSVNRVVDKYPKSDKAPGALLKKGYGYLAMNDRPRAIVQFQYVVHEYPNSRESALAKDRLRQLGIDIK